METTWRIISAVDYLSGEEAIYRILEGENLPAEYRNLGPECEHCHQNRARKTVYVVLSSDSKYRQVGSTCLHDFTGQDEAELVGAFREQLEIDEDERIRQSRMIDMLIYLSHVAMVIREYGWLGATKARELGKTPTADYALSSLHDSTHPNETDIATAKSAIQWAQTISDEETNGYLHNLHILAAQYSIEPKHLNIVASMIVAHERAQAREAERMSKAAQSQHFGTVGKREVFTLTVERVFSRDTEYGVSHIHTMRDMSGNVAVWFATRELLNVGQSYTMKATVKSHGERDGIAQTILTRCAVECVW